MFQLFKNREYYVLYSASKEIGIYKSQKDKQIELLPLAARRILDELSKIEALTIAISRSHFPKTRNFLQTGLKMQSWCRWEVHLNL